MSKDNKPLSSEQIIAAVSLPPITVEYDDVGESILLQRETALIATVHNFYDFPCLDEDVDMEAIDEQAKADAHRFAASEDLLQACEQALKDIADDKAKVSGVKQVLRQAIAKAKGEL